MSKRVNSFPFRVRRSRIQGQGAFATRNIRKGQLIAEYVGELIDPSEEANRYNGNGRRHHTFLFGVDKGPTIDGGVGGNESRFINHSCTPNCESVERKCRVFIYALRAIKAGEEITYDYHFEVSGRVTRADREYYACNCGTVNCRGTILDVERMRRRARRRLLRRQANAKKAAKNASSRKRPGAKRKTSSKKRSKKS